MNLFLFNILILQFNDFSSIHWNYINRIIVLAYENIKKIKINLRKPHTCNHDLHVIIYLLLVTGTSCFSVCSCDSSLCIISSFSIRVAAVETKNIFNNYNISNVHVCTAMKAQYKLCVHVHDNVQDDLLVGN